MNHWLESAVPLPQRHSPVLHLSGPHETRDPSGRSPEPPVASAAFADGVPRGHPGAARSSLPWLGADPWNPAAAEARHSHRSLLRSSGSHTGVYPWSAGTWLGRGLSGSRSCLAAAGGSGVGGPAGESAAAGDGALMTRTGVHVFECEVSLHSLGMRSVPFCRGGLMFGLGRLPCQSQVLKQSICFCACAGVLACLTITSAEAKRLLLCLCWRVRSGSLGHCVAHLRVCGQPRGQPHQHRPFRGPRGAPAAPLLLPMVSQRLHPLSSHLLSVLLVACPSSQHSQPSCFHYSAHAAVPLPVSAPEQ